MAYLDDSGLAYFWQKIKAKLNAKADSNLGAGAANKTVVTDSSGNMTTRKAVDGYTIVQSLPTSNIDENTVYLVPSSGGGGGGGGGSGVTYALSRSGDNIILTGSDGSTSTVDGGKTGAEVQTMIEDIIEDVLGVSY